MQKENEAARRRSQGQMLRKLARIQREIQGAVENCDGVFNITRDEVDLSETLFRVCFASYREEPLENNLCAARLVGYVGGVRFCTYIKEGSAWV